MILWLEDEIDRNIGSYRTLIEMFKTIEQEQHIALVQGLKNNQERWAGIVYEDVMRHAADDEGADVPQVIQDFLDQPITLNRVYNALREAGIRLVTNLNDFCTEYCANHRQINDYVIDLNIKGNNYANFFNGLAKYYRKESYKVEKISLKPEYAGYFAILYILNHNRMVSNPGVANIAKSIQVYTQYADDYKKGISECFDQHGLDAALFEDYSVKTMEGITVVSKLDTRVELYFAKESAIKKMEKLIKSEYASSRMQYGNDIVDLVQEIIDNSQSHGKMRSCYEALQHHLRVGNAPQHDNVSVSLLANGKSKQEELGEQYCWVGLTNLLWNLGSVSQHGSTSKVSTANHQCYDVLEDSIYPLFLAYLHLSHYLKTRGRIK